MRRDGSRQSVWEMESTETATSNELKTQHEHSEGNEMIMCRCIFAERTIDGQQEEILKTIRRSSTRNVKNAAFFMLDVFKSFFRTKTELFLGFPRLAWFRIGTCRALFSYTSRESLFATVVFVMISSFRFVSTQRRKNASIVLIRWIAAIQLNPDIGTCK